jgi:glycine/D-amino acid oxidase-like deaminating enzyme
MPIDVLIVGQGLAGSLLAWELLRREFKVVIIDNGARNASQVAAGLINPVTGQRLVKSHGVDVLLPEAMKLYGQLAEHFGQAFFVSKPMLRVLGSAKQRQLAEQRLQDANYQSYLDGLVEVEAGIHSEHGILRQRDTGYLRTTAILEQLRNAFIANASYRQSEFDYSELSVQPVLQWRDLQPRHLVFCEGYRLVGNPWFGQLPLQPSKGEILHCKAAGLKPDAIVNYGFWMIPDEQQAFKTGATFDVACVDSQPTATARQQLLQALTSVCPDLADFEVVDHQAGIRPTTLDKQPFVGSHPFHDKLHIFNGFGAKGSLAIPFYARKFADALTRQAPLPADCDIRRFHDTYFAG